MASNNPKRLRRLAEELAQPTRLRVVIKAGRGSASGGKLPKIGRQLPCASVSFVEPNRSRPMQALVKIFGAPPARGRTGRRPPHVAIARSDSKIMPPLRMC
jgi:hypothetical protein